MKKTIIRDYVVDCFRLYESLKPHEKRLEEEKYKCLFADYSAVKKTFEQIKTRPDGEYIEKAVKLVYCKRDGQAFKKNEISQNVIETSSKLFCSEMTVYRYLKIARDIFCEIRGLRTDGIITELFSA